MTVAVMQPYAFPYLGYYQMAAAVDKFVFFDDVNFIMKGWINRNRILQQNEPFKFTIPLNKASQNRLIKEIEISGYPKWRDEFLRLIDFNYKKAPQYSFTREWLRNFLFQKDYLMIGDLAASSVASVCEVLGLKTQFLFSSFLNYRDSLAAGGQKKILRICEILEAGRYVNAVNGMDMYEEDEFQAKGIDLKFIVMDEVRYDQFDKQKFASSLSIIDVMMFNDLNGIKDLLKCYKLINKQVAI